jgi:hypothetical protein
LFQSVVQLSSPLFHSLPFSSTLFYSLPFSSILFTLIARFTLFDRDHHRYLTADQLQVTSTGNVLTAPEINCTTVHDIVGEWVKGLAVSLEARRGHTNPSAAEAFVKEIRSTAADVAGVRSNIDGILLAADVDMGINPIVIKGEGRCKIPMTVTRPPGRSTQATARSTQGHLAMAVNDAVVYVTGPTASAPSATYHADRVAALVNAGFTVVRPVLCGLEDGGVYDVTSNKSTSNRVAADVAQGLNRYVRSQFRLRQSHWLSECGPNQ